MDASWHTVKRGQAKATACRDLTGCLFFFKTNVCYDFRAEEGNHEVCGTIWFGLHDDKQVLWFGHFLLINQCVSPSAFRPTFPELLVQDVEDLLVPAYKVFVARIKGGAIAISSKYTQIISHQY